MQVALILARGRNHVVGRDGGLPWHLPREVQHFDHTTKGHAVIMGRGSYEDHDSCLAGRLNVVVSSSRSDFADGVLVAANLEQALELASASEPPAFVIGGPRLWQAALPAASIVWETVVEAEPSGDVFAKPMDFSGWSTTRWLRHPADDRHEYAFTVLKHERERGR